MIVPYWYIFTQLETFYVPVRKKGAQAGMVLGSCPVVQLAVCPVCSCSGLTTGSPLSSSGAPVVSQITAPPGTAVPDTGFLLVTVALIGVGCVVLIGGSMLVRRWWIRRQNPALFLEYD